MLVPPLADGYAHRPSTVMFLTRTPSSTIPVITFAVAFFLGEPDGTVGISSSSFASATQTGQ